MKTVNAKPPGRWKAALGTLALLLASLLFTAVIGEVAVRVLSPQQLVLIRPDLWVPADTVGWLRQLNVNSTVNTGEGAVRFISDHEGFRVGERGRTEGVPVLVLGDSFMEALQVEYEQSLPGHLENTLDAALSEPVAIRNAGVSGWAPVQYLARARVLLPQDRYRLVITAIYVGNDARPTRVDYTPPREPLTRHPFRLPRGISKAELLDAGLHPLNESLEVRSHLYVLLRRRLEVLRKKVGMSANYFPVEFLKSEATSERWRLTADVCTEIAEVARHYGAQALFVLIPTDFQVNPDKFHQYVNGFGIDTATVALDQPTERLREELSKRGLHLIDALPRFRELQASGASLYGVVDEHLNAAGHQALSDVVSPVAAELLAGSCDLCLPAESVGLTRTDAAGRP
jgi:hypothetical protein